MDLGAPGYEALRPMQTISKCGTAWTIRQV